MAERHDSGMAAIGCMVASTTCFSLSGFFGLQAVSVLGDWPVVFARFAIPLTVLGLGLGRGIRETIRDIHGVQLLRSVALVASQALFLETASRSGLFLAIVLYNTGPLFIVLIESIHRRQAPSQLALLGVALGFMGVGTIHAGLPAGAAHALMLGVSSGFCFAVSQFTLYLGARHRDHKVVLVQTFLWCAILACIPCLHAATPAWADVDASMRTRLVIALVLAGVFSLGNQWFRGLAYRRATNVSSLAPLLYFGAVVSACLDAISTRKAPLPTACLGTLLIVSGALIPGWRQSLLPLLGVIKRATLRT